MRSGEWVVSASWDNTLKVWDARTGAELLTLEGHTDAIHGCAVSPLGDYLVSASGDGTLKVWGLDRSRVATMLEGHTDWVRSCGQPCWTKLSAWSISSRTTTRAPYACSTELGRRSQQLVGHSIWQL